MGHYYRERHQAASTTSDDIEGITGSSEGDEYEGKTLAQLRAEAGELGLPTYGTKAEVFERIEDAKNSDDSNE